MTADDPTVQDVYDSFTPGQKDVVHLIVGSNLAAVKVNAFELARVAYVYRTFTDSQKAVVEYITEEAKKQHEQKRVREQRR